MKFEINPSPVFRPCSLTIVFESQKELDAFGSLMNTTRVAETLRVMSDNYTLRPSQSLAELGANILNSATVEKHLQSWKP